MHETSRAKLNLSRWGCEFGPQLFWAELAGFDLLGLDIPNPTLGPAGLVGPTSLGLTQSSSPIYYALICVSYMILEPKLRECSIFFTLISSLQSPRLSNT
nr:hypothetical protein CFP56_65840 [Quercus suber]